MAELIVLIFLILLFNLVDSIFILRYHEHLYGAVRWEKRKFVLRFTIIILSATVVISAIPAMILWGMTLFSSFWMGAYHGGKKNKDCLELSLYLCLL